MTTQRLTPAGQLLHAAWKLLLLGILLYGIGSSLYVLASATVGERWSWVALANNFLPWWALGGLIAAIVALGSSWRWALVALQVPVLAAFVLLYGDLLLPPNATATPAGPRFTAASFNILGAHADPEAIGGTIRDLDADIIGLQEVVDGQSEYLEPALAGDYPYQVHYPQWPVHGVALLSRYPIRAEQVFRLLPDSMLGLRAEVDVNGVPLTVYVVHPSPPTNMLDFGQYDSTRRDREIAILLEDYLAREQGPVVVLGDFNMADLSTPYHAMSAEFDDAFRRAGQGFGFTFPADHAPRLLPRMLRIDYVWYNARLTALAAHAGGDSGTSDHIPVIADLALNESTAAE